MKVLVATDKPFAKVAVDGIRKEIEAAGYELVLLEKYGEKAFCERKSPNQGTYMGYEIVQ